MKTYRFFLAALAAMGFMTSCNNEVVETSAGQEIAFRLQGGTPSIVSRATATTLATMDAFVVYGTDDKLGATGDMLFDGVTVAKDFNTGLFKYAPAKYYSEGATNAGFFAFSPASASVTPTIPTTFLTTGASFEYTVPAPDASGYTVQEDLLVAGASVNPTVPGSVSLAFTHALSRIFVSATNEAADPVIITGLTLLNLNTQGTLEVNPLSGWSWTGQTNPDDYAYVLAGSGLVGGVAVPPSVAPLFVTSMEQGMLILPQRILNSGPDNRIHTPGEFALQVDYNFANLSNLTKLVLIDDGTGGYDFVPNKQYRININFTGTAIEFTVTVVDDFDAPLENVNTTN